MNKFFWEVTFEDVRIGTEVKLGEICAIGSEMSNSVIAIVDDTLNGLFGDNKKTVPKEGEGKVAKTRDEFIAAFNNVVNPK